MNQAIASSLLLLLAGCPDDGDRAETGECPSGETCSPATPDGLVFTGATPGGEGLSFGGEAPTAVGGTQVITLGTAGDGSAGPFELPYIADDGDGVGVRVAGTTGANVTLDGVGPATNYLRILDPSNGELYDRKQLTAAAVDEVALLPGTYEQVPTGLTVVFAPGAQQVVVGLIGHTPQTGSAAAPTRLVDTSLQVAADGATRTAWDTLSFGSAAPSSSVLTVTAAGQQFALQLDFVAAPDTIELSTPSTVAEDTGPVCFTAKSLGRYVGGLSWQFTVNGESQPSWPSLLPANCTWIANTPDVEIVASAGGLTTTAHITVTAAPQPDAAPRPSLGGAAVAATAGERAALHAAAQR
jgi:hypothetical protein